MIKASDVNKQKKIHQAAIRLNTYSFATWVLIAISMIFSLFYIDDSLRNLFVIGIHIIVIIFAIGNAILYWKKRRELVSLFNKAIYN